MPNFIVLSRATQGELVGKVMVLPPMPERGYVPEIQDNQALACILRLKELESGMSPGSRRADILAVSSSSPSQFGLGGVQFKAVKIEWQSLVQRDNLSPQILMVKVGDRVPADRVSLPISDKEAWKEWLKREKERVGSSSLRPSAYPPVDPYGLYL